MITSSRGLTIRGVGDELARVRHRSLLRMRIMDLALKPSTGYLRRQVQSLYGDLAQAGFEHFRPDVYLGDEWFSPEGVPAIAVPFFLAHPRLRRLEEAYMGEAEGATPAWCRKLLRHEAGHCFDHAYRVSKSARWRRLFGDPGQRYRPDNYVFDPMSRDFVRHLPGYYAQAHPDEDFAETFAICVTPGLNWRRRYRAWPGALAKLEYVQELIERYGPRRPRVASGPHWFSASRMRTTLGRFYQRRARRALPLTTEV